MAICEQCRYYEFFDSGYGYCKRFPPKIIIKRITWKLRVIHDTIFPMVAWTAQSCGEFKSKAMPIKLKLNKDNK